MKNIENILSIYNIKNISYNELRRDEKQKIAVLVYAINEVNEIILLERLKEPFKGKLTPPGGKVEPEEDIINAVKREFLEETGFNLISPELKIITSETGPIHYNWVLFVFTGKVKKAELKECDEGILKWIKKENYISENISEIDRKCYPFVFQNEKIYFINIDYDEDKNADITLIKELN